jgi:ABC-2 type transport system permease protein
MKKVIRLLSVQIWMVLGEMLSVGRSQNKKPKVLYVGVAFFTLLMTSVSFMYNFMIGTGLKYFNSLELLPVLIMAATSIMIAMTTVFKIKGTIFGFRDYDMVMSLPISTGGIVACRVIILYAFNFLFVIILNIPMIVVYGILAAPGISFYVSSLLLMFFLPLIPIIAASVLGTVIAYAAARFKHSNFLNIVFSMLLVIAIVGASFTLNGNGQQMVAMSEALTKQINSIYPLAKMYTNAVIHSDIIDLVMFVIISVAAFLIYTFIIKAVFKKMNTMLLAGSSRSNYKLGRLKTSSIFIALYKKELKRFFSSSIYVTNTAFGIVILTIAAIASIFIDLDKIFPDPMVLTLLNNYVPFIITFCVIMTYTAASAISLEGKSLWILKTLPVAPKTVYHAKLAVNLTITAPAIVDIIIIGVVLKIGTLQTIVLLFVTVACACFTSLLGLLINIIIPNFNWTSEVMVVKQSAAGMISVFAGMFYIAVQFGCYVLLPNSLWANITFFIVTSILDGVLYFMIMTYGKRRYYAF